MRRSMKARRLLSALLSLILLLGMLPAAAIPTEAAGETQQYVSLPITIRDYASDGMLFEYSDKGTTGDSTVNTDTSLDFDFYTQGIGAYPESAITKSESDGIVTVTASSANSAAYIYTNGEGSIGKTVTDIRYLAIRYKISAVQSNKTPTIAYQKTLINGTYPSTTAINLQADNSWHAVVLDMGTSTDTVWRIKIFPYLAAGATMQIDYLAAFSTQEEAETYITTGGSSSVASVYHHGNTIGYGLVSTNTASHYGALAAADNAIAGTSYILNGTFGSSTVPAAVDALLNSGAVQKVYGALLRTNLVEGTLGTNGKPVYTKAAVDYLADYIQKTLAEEWQNADGSYNMWYVMGTELSELGGTDLATKIRTQTAANGNSLGEYTASRTKFENGQLSDYTQITTYYDAAYFLLHNTFADNTGYGKTVGAYKTLNLVARTDADGDTHYVFTSAYDGAVYDTTNGVIYNSQTDTITARKDSDGDDQYVRGNIQPEARFNPLNGLGYGNAASRDTYALAKGDAQEAYYDNTNYHMTLEGHAQFIYYYDDDLYFTFTGDDDVYLYINGIRVLDLGGGHAISKATININDVAVLCGLQDGEAYTFDFYYMERHGTAANFGIETNIQIVDPSMVTTKTGFQNGGEVGYNGFVNPQQPVIYQFGLQNNGAADITSLTFMDNDIGIALSSAAITLNSETMISDLTVTKYDAGGIPTVYSGSELTESTLMNLLAAGLKVGEKITIYGFKYTIPDAKWSNDAFDNIVYTTAVSDAGNTSTKVLNGIANYRVQKQIYTFANLHYYDWGKLNASKNDGTFIGTSVGITLPITDIIEAVTNAGVVLTGNGFVSLCSPSGGSSGYINPNAQLNGSTITYSATKTGVDSFYCMVMDQAGAFYGPIRVDVYVYGVMDNIYVLDYSLPVELNGVNFGLSVNDTLTLSANPYTTAATMQGIANNTSSYGTFVYTPGGTTAVEDGCFGGYSLKYTMSSFMNGEDTVHVSIQILEAGATALSSKTGVLMTQTVTVAPASVVYYEDDFAGITYVNTVAADTETGEVDYEESNIWAFYETVNSWGEKLSGREQSADQSLNYGEDPNYTTNKENSSEESYLTFSRLELSTDSLRGFADGAADLNALFNDITSRIRQKLGAFFWGGEYVDDTIEGDASNGTLHVLEVKSDTAQEILYFEFQGTGFEIISRTTEDAYAVITAKVYSGTDTDNSGTIEEDEYTLYKMVPVITESIGGDLYQVPVIAVKDMPFGSYKVTLTASNTGSDDGVVRMVYIDGIRIYGPLENGEALEYYASDEAMTTIREIKTEISESYADNANTIVYADILDGGIAYGWGTTMVEAPEPGGNVLITSVDDPDTYLTIGPNNEIYLAADGTVSDMSLIAMYLKPVDRVEYTVATDTGTETQTYTYTDENRTIQIGAHRKADMYLDAGNAYLVYGGSAEVMAAGTYFYEVASGTEQYYTIDPACLSMDEQGRYLLLIGTDAPATLSLTNIKLGGYEFVPGAAELLSAAAEPTAGYSSRMLSETRALAAMFSPAESVITVNENLKVESASFATKRVFSGMYNILTVKVTGAVSGLIIRDSDGNAVEFSTLSVHTSEPKNPVSSIFGFLWGSLWGNSGGSSAATEESAVTTTYTLSWQISGSRGEEKVYTVEALDVDGAVSANTVTVSCNIR